MTDSTSPRLESTPARRRFLKHGRCRCRRRRRHGGTDDRLGADDDFLRSRAPGRRKDIFHEYALDFAKKVNDMAGGELKIEVLPAGSVVPAFGLLDAVYKGTLDGGHGVLGYHYGKRMRWRCGTPARPSAWTPNMLLAWHKYGGGKDLLARALRARSAQRRAPSCTARCRRSRWAGSRSRSPRPRTSRA